jgi:membrane-associated phospholipid phosphatase
VFREFDIELLRLIHNSRIEALDRWLYFVSYSASFVSIGIVLVLLILFLKNKSPELRSAFYKMLAVLIVAALLSFTLKNLITRDRPFKTYPEIEKLSEAGSSSFPSGHTLEAFAMAVALSVTFRQRRIIIPIFTWAILVAYTRMALGVHYPSDVVAGLITGSLIGWLIPRLFQTKTRIQS